MLFSCSWLFLSCLLNCLKYHKLSYFSNKWNRFPWTGTHYCFSWSKGLFAHSGLQSYFVTNGIKEWTISFTNKNPLISIRLRNFIEKTQKALEYVLLISKYKCNSFNGFLLLNCSFLFLRISVLLYQHL